jgi:hypothetical protein
VAKSISTMKGKNNKLDIRNEDMTRKEALLAKKQLKHNSIPPALST